MVKFVGIPQAICNALHVSSAVIRELIDQPITAREYKSMITAR